MNPLLKLFLKLILFTCIVFNFFSCNKDADLFSDYVINENTQLESLALLVDDRFFISSNQSRTVMNVLGNDLFDPNVTVTITETSTPKNGTVTINEDNELIYTLNPDISTDTSPDDEDTPITDDFTYTTEVADETSETTMEGNVSVTINTSGSNEDLKTISTNITNWKKLFDSQTIDDERQIAYSLSGDGGDIYYLDVSPYVYMFQVTGEDSYMDFAMGLFQNVMQTANDAATKGDGYLGWKDTSSGLTNGVGSNDGTEVSLAEGRGMRTVARMLWVLAKSPTYLSKGNNEKVYNEMFEWFTKHVWEKWESRGINNIYRSRTHMASHWAQIAWFLHGITGDEHYRDYYIGWSSGMTEGPYVGESMRKQLRETNLGSGKTGYIWNAKWGSLSGANDVSHANAEVELMVLGAEMNDYWTLDDMRLISNTFEELIFTSNSWDKTAYYIDGSGSAAAFWDQGWIQLGRFSQSLQDKLEKADLLPSYYYYQKVRIANLAYNQAYLEQNLFYPE